MTSKEELQIEKNRSGEWQIVDLKGKVFASGFDDDDEAEEWLKSYTPDKK